MFLTKASDAGIRVSKAKALRSKIYVSVYGFAPSQYESCRDDDNDIVDAVRLRDGN